VTGELQRLRTLPRGGRCAALALASLAGALALFPRGPARADESRFRPYLVGGRASGMGGAFTALADDGSGPWYNPAGVAFVRRSQLSIAGSVYGLVSGSFHDALGDGHDFRYRGLNTFPSVTAGVWKLGAPGAEEGGVLSLGVFVPDAVDIDDRDRLGSAQDAFFYSEKTRTVWGGLTYAHRLGHLGIGATAFLLYGSRIVQEDLTATSQAAPDQFATLSARTDETTFGVAGAIGLRWDATEALHLGLSLYSPALGGGRRRVFLRATLAAGAPGPLIEVVNEGGLRSTLSQPLRLQSGLAWVSGPLTLAADLVYLAPRKVHDNADRQAEGLDQRVERRAVVDGSVGLELLVGERYALRAGLFTDLSTSPRPVAYLGSANPNPTYTSHVDRYGATLSAGFRTEHTSTDFGVNASAGTGTDLVPDKGDFSSFHPSRSTQLLVYVFIATGYSF
jgi:long-chain fatty acid transport protein